MKILIDTTSQTVNDLDDRIAEHEALTGKSPDLIYVARKHYHLFVNELLNNGLITINHNADYPHLRFGNIPISILRHS